MTHLRRAVGAGVISLALTATGCTSAPDAEPDDAEPTGSEQSTSAPLAPDDAAGIGLDDGRLKTAGRVDARIDPMTEIGPLSVTPDGLVAVSVTRSDSRNPLRLIRADVALMDPKSGRRKVISTPAQSKGIQVSGAVATRRWLAWTTTTTTTMSENPWTLYSYDRNTGRTYKLAGAPTLPDGGAPMTNDYSVPSIAGDRVYLTGASSVQPGRTLHTSVYSAALDGSGSLREDFRDQQDPIASGKTIVTAREARDDTVQIVEHTPRPTDDGGALVAAGRGIEAHAHAADSIVWVEKLHGSHVVHVKEGDGEAQTIMESPHGLNDLVMTENHLQFEIRNVPYWYDLDTDTLLALDQRDVYLPGGGNGEYVVWKTDSPHYGKPGGDIVVARLDPE